jgi:membrane protein DedA with SNARE-associated domain
MIIALILMVIGGVAGMRAKIFVLIPIGIVVTLVVFSYWVATGSLDWMKVAVWFGYIAALNTGYILGRLYTRSREMHG